LDFDAVQDQEVATKARREPPIKRKGAMGDFLGELQKEQAQREERYKDKIAGEFFIVKGHRSGGN
jgi:hypothetical protein